MRRAVLASAGTAAILAGGLMTATPANAAPVVTGGLVNVTIVDAVDVTNNQILNGITVQAAAAICGISVQALVVDLGPDGIVSDCDASNTTTTKVTQRRGGSR